MLLVVLAACNNSTETNGNNSDGNKNNTPENDSEVNVEESDEEVTLTFIAPWREEQVRERFADDFEEKYPNIKIKHVSSWTDAASFEEQFAKILSLMYT